MNQVTRDILSERQRQDEKWGQQFHQPDTWLQILMEEIGEFSEESLNLKFAKSTDYPNFDKLRTEAIQIAAVAMAIVENIDKY